MAVNSSVIASQYTTAEAHLHCAAKDKWLFLFMLASESLFCVRHQNVEDCRQGKASRLNMQSIRVFAVMLFVR